MQASASGRCFGAALARWHFLHGASGAHRNMEAQPAEDQMEWMTMGYTQEAMKKL